MSLGLTAASSIFKKVLLNGLTVLVRPVENIPQVSVQLWYHVGSKDEMIGEKGNAHLIEHMIFKGTDILSESDIKAVTNKFSGKTNAFTFYDYTGYIFEFPSQSWKETFPILANCMRNCRFETEMLNSELKAVIQELKMYRDNNVRSLVSAMFASIFIDHPYHYPIIGFKQDLWSLNRDDLFAFYKKHYVPNNATLVVVGDVNPEEVFAEAEKKFGAIAKDPTYKRKEFYLSKDLVSQNVTLYRDVKESCGLIMFVLPGAKDKKDYEISLLSIILGELKSSPLRKKLVDDLKIVTQFSTSFSMLEDACIFNMFFSLKNESSIEEIKKIIQDYIQEIITNGIDKELIFRAEKEFKVNLLTHLEVNYNQAQTIATDFLYTKDENYTFKMLSERQENLEQKIKTLLKDYFSPSVMHVGQVLPLSEQGKEQWKDLQKLSDKEDARILDGRIRNIPLEQDSYVNSLSLEKKKHFNYPKAEKFTLKNGVKVFCLENKNIPKIELAVSLKARLDYDSEELSGLYSFMCKLMLEGTKKYPGHLLAEEIEKHGMSFSVSPGVIFLSFLKEDLQKALELVAEVLMHALFEEDKIEKMRAISSHNIKMYWDDPMQYSFSVASKIIYKNHPYAKSSLGAVESIEKITRKDIVDFYEKYITGYKARISVVGDFSGYDLKAELEKTLGLWQAKKIEDLDYPEIVAAKNETINRSANRDQVVLMFIARSISRLHNDYEKLLLFDQILSKCGMDSRLFKIREETGLFYAITGSLTDMSDEHGGMMYISTIVSLDKLSESKKRILELLNTIVDSITQEELDRAKESILNGQIDNFKTNQRTLVTYLNLDRFNFSEDYFEKRESVLQNITLDQVKDAARKVLNLAEISTLQIGRV